MADTCIVCLGDLRTSVDEDLSPEAAAVAVTAKNSSNSSNTKNTANSEAKSSDIKHDDETIAHLLPCKHKLHNACLEPWVERANSCPICRTKFNMVELRQYADGAVIDSYAVQDKVQEAELDPGIVVEDEAVAAEMWEPCIQCGAIADGHGVMYCDGCDRCVHVFCAGFDNAPDIWYCETCMIDMENDADLPGMASAVRRRARRRNGSAPQQGRRRNNDATIWARVWQEVSRRLDLDLDFPFDEESSNQRTEEQRREFRRWERRFEVADRQGTANRLRGIAAAQFNADNIELPEPESQEELRAWNAFDKARESQEAPLEIRRRKRKATDSPASPHENEQTAQPQLKRPRLRRPMGAMAEPRAGESSSAAARRNGDERTFLSSLLREVETKPVSAASPTASEQINGQFSPRNSSPMQSPSPSEPGTPRAAVTPPPQRPLSPPLSSTIIPALSPLGLTFSPFSPTSTGQDPDGFQNLRVRGRRRQQSADEGITSVGRASSSSPSRALSYSAKEEIQRMVKLALGTRYRDKEISKDQYTDINRDVSRRLYELVGNASALADQTEREKWQAVANEEVQKAIGALSDSAND